MPAHFPPVPVPVAVQSTRGTGYEAVSRRYVILGVQHAALDKKQGLASRATAAAAAGVAKTAGERGKVRRIGETGGGPNNEAEGRPTDKEGRARQLQRCRRPLRPPNGRASFTWPFSLQDSSRSFLRWGAKSTSEARGVFTA